MNSDYLYKFGCYPDNKRIINDLHSAAARLNNKLAALELGSLGVTEYNQRYFGGHIESNRARNLNLTKYGYILAWAIANIEKPKEQIVFLDYGAGHGMLSLLAKEFGIGTVVHNDIYPVSCDDARLIGNALDLEADAYIPGDLDDAIAYFGTSGISCDSVASYDVIEHIYDIEGFLSKVHGLSSKGLSMFMASSANERNPIINRRIKKIHVEFENKDRGIKPGRKPTDATRAIIELRKSIIHQYAKDLSGQELDNLAFLTRGLIKAEIEQSVDQYICSGTLPALINHSTNTCDPYTGNWFEHLINPDWMVKILDQSGFKSSVMCGFYDSPGSSVKGAVKLLLNMVIRLMGKSGLIFAPYYAIYSVKDE